MSALTVGTVLELPDLPGRWSVWSPSADAPGAVFVTPTNDEARATGVKYAVVKAINKASQAKPEMTLLRTDPALPVTR